jgi:hypothetical protein
VVAESPQVLAAAGFDDRQQLLVEAVDQPRHDRVAGLEPSWLLLWIAGSRAARRLTISLKTANLPSADVYRAAPVATR